MIIPKSESMMRSFQMTEFGFAIPGNPVCVKSPPEPMTKKSERRSHWNVSRILFPKVSKYCFKPLTFLEYKYLCLKSKENSIYRNQSVFIKRFSRRISGMPLMQTMAYTIARLYNPGSGT